MTKTSRHPLSRQTPRRVRAFLIGLACLGLGACGDGAVEPPPVPLTLTTEGRLERGAQLRVTALQGAAPVTGVTFRAEPESAVQWLEAGLARLVGSGPVTFHATSATATGSLAVNVQVPPAVVFESTHSGTRSVWRMALDGEDLLQLTDDSAEDASPSAAGGAVYFLSYRTTPAAVFQVPAAGGPATRVTTVSAAYEEPVISPDGALLAFLRNVGGVSKLHVSDRSGANARRVTASGAGVIEVSPAWSPGGTMLAFVSTAAGNADVYTVPVAGGTPQGVGATSQPEVEPAWSPDGTRIVFVRGSGGEADLWVGTVATGAATQLTTRPGSETRPAWLPDGRIVFTVTAGSERQLHWLDPAAPGTLHRIPHAVPVSGRPAALR
jgi:hypothetical protein